MTIRNPVHPGDFIKTEIVRARSTSGAIGRIPRTPETVVLGTLRGMRYTRHSKPLMLTDDERQTLEQWARRPKTSQRLALQARVVLACAQRQTNRAVAARLPLPANSVCKWRERFRVRRLEGLTDEPRPGTPRKATDDRIVDVITRTLEGPPAHTTQWTTRSMAEVAGLSKATISRIWQTSTSSWTTTARTKCRR
jgi:transposase